MTAQHRTQQPRPLTALACFSGLTIVQGGLGLLLLPVYVKFISPADYGVLAAVTVVAAIVGVASNLKLDAAMRTFFFDYERNEEKLQAYVRKTFAASILASCLVSGSRPTRSAPSRAPPSASCSWRSSPARC